MKLSIVLKPARLFLICLLLSGLHATSGCISIGHRPPSDPTPAGPTLGQQLLDLKRAHDAGALTADEYQQQRNRLLNGRR